MTHAFAPMPHPERASFAAHYMRYLREREGVPCLRTRTFSRREARPREAAPRAPRLVDPAVFARNLDRCQPEPGLDRATLWALAVAKGNRAERYGVEHKLARRGFEPGGAEDLITYVEIQECYHTRLLIRVLRLVGLDCDVGAPVGRVTRMGVRLFGQFPRPVIDVLALPFEVVGIAAFRALREEAREIFAHHPGLRDSIDACFAEILVDEVGHVHFLRSRLGPRRLTLARALLPFAQRALFDDNDEVRMLLARRGGLSRLAEMRPDEAVAHDPERLPALVAQEMP